MKQRVRWAALLMLAATMAARPARGDVVYLRSGKTHEGKVTRAGAKVHIRTGDGKRITVAAKDVVHIATGSDAVDVQPTPAPKQRGPTLGPTPAPIDPEKLTQPESFVFLYERVLAGTPDGSKADLAQMLKRWRSAAHDRKRKVGLRWLGPDDFIRRREIFDKTHEEARDLFRKASRRGTSPKDRANRNRYRMAARTQYRIAAKAWTDPLLRAFLLGIVELETGSKASAEKLFRKCRTTAPLVAAFHQGHAMALLTLKRPSDALAAYNEVLRLEPESRDAAELVRDTMKRVPGSQTSHAPYLRAKKLLAERTRGRRRSSSRRGTTWLLPGKDVAARDSSLPILPYDRLVFRQAVGVPVRENTLVVDAKALAGALAAYVQIGPTLVPAETPRAYRSRRAPDQPIASLTVPGYSFTPAKLPKLDDKDAKDTLPAAPSAGDRFYSVGLFAEMGSVLREGRFEQEADDAAGAPGKLTGGLIAGESTAPVLDESGRLIGFLAGKTNPAAAGGGDGKFIPLTKLKDVLSRLRRSRRWGSSRSKTKAEPTAAEGKVFLVSIITAERFGDPKRR